ncbi:MAG: glycosyl transferase family 9 [Lacunisphaera sp.]|nr:glycosyl transferase family 9 [Lacunisphaera sp.]MDB6165914.1 glycosyl transferase family 9 [Lacunisphaera sp.]
MRAITPLVMRFGAMGDMVLLIPMLKALQQRYGQPCGLVSSGSWTVPLMQRVPACGEVQLLTSRRAPYWFNRSQQQFVDTLRHRPPGPVYVFEPDEKPLALLHRGGVGPEWICSVRDLPRQPGEHIAAHALRLARETPAALRASPDFVPPPLLEPDTRPSLSEADRRDCAAWLVHHQLAGAPLVLLQPGNKKTMKGGDRQRSSNVDYWPETHWAEVITGVRQLLPAARIIICGAPSERPLAEDIVARIPGQQDGVLIATDELPIPRLLALQERAHSLISVNTGPAHSAAAMGCPEVVMFTRHAHRSAELYAPLPTTAPVRIILPNAAEPDADLASITPDTVTTAWHEMSVAFWQQRPGVLA